MSEKDIREAIANGKTVHWSNVGYVVTATTERLWVTFIHNQYITGLQPSELKDCFVA